MGKTRMRRLLSFASIVASIIRELQSSRGLFLEDIDRSVVGTIVSYIRFLPCLLSAPVGGPPFPLM